MQTITQLSPPTATQTIDIQDITALPVTLTSNNGVSLGTNGLGTQPGIQFATVGDLIALGSIIPGNAGSNASVTISSGQSMTLNGNVGLAGVGNTTTVNVGANKLGTGTLTQAAGTAIIGDNVLLTSLFAINGNLGTSAIPDQYAGYYPGAP